MSSKMIPLNTAHAIMDDVEKGMPRGLAVAYHTFTKGQKDPVKVNIPVKPTVTPATEPTVTEMPEPKLEAKVDKPSRWKNTTDKAIADSRKSVMARPKGMTKNVKPIQTKAATIKAPTGRHARLEKMTGPQVIRALAKLAGRYSYESISKYILDPKGTKYSAMSVRNWSTNRSKPDDSSLAAIRRFLLTHRDYRSSLPLLSAAGDRN